MPGDIPKSLIADVVHDLAKPLTKIYNACLAHMVWPKLWKREVVIPIPKTQTPKDFNDIVPISMSPLWSKVIELIISEFTFQETNIN